MKLEVLNTQGEKTGRKVDLPDYIFGIEPNEHSVYLDVKRIRNAIRSGNHKTKERSEIRGSRKKLRRQKGTGFARVGDVKSPIFRGGGRVFGPKVRNYDIKINKKVQRLAKKSALSTKLSNKQLYVVEDFNLETPKTKDFAHILDNLEIDGNKSLFVNTEFGENTKLSMRNIPNVDEKDTKALNTYDILRYKTLVLTENSVEELKKTLSK
ncbi:MAG: 50S ribosomal protein L4 [Bacteroidetes bacterium SW_10_40_5]|nr:MAG: 50S ribosomal protein L4 [Bacteroidetes bacterium SW_10_40_5]